MLTPNPPTRCSPAARAYTLVEGVIVLAIVAILAALVFVAVGSVVRTVRANLEAQLLRTVRLAVDQFRQEHGFYPPLLDDRARSSNGGVEAIPATTDVNPDGRLVLASEQFARGSDDPAEQLHEQYLRFELAAPNEPRWSTRSLPAYLFGGLGERVDGSRLAGSGKPSPDGTFDLAGRKFPPVLDAAPFTRRLVGAKFDTANNSVRAIDCGLLTDRWGGPIRYYRWSPTLHRRDGGASGFDLRVWPVFPVNASQPNTIVPNDPARAGEIRSYNVSPAVGDAAEEPALRRAQYAIVSAGPDGLFGDEPLDDVGGVPGLRTRLGMGAEASEAAVRRRARQDNLREVGP